MTTKPEMVWSRHEAASDFARLLNDAAKRGPQKIIDGERVYEVRIVKHAATSTNDILDEPGPLTDENHAAAFGSDNDKSSR